MNRLLVIGILLLLAVISLGWQISQSADVPTRVQIRGPLNANTIGATAAPFPIREIGHPYLHISTAGTFPAEEAVFGTLYGVVIATAPNNATIQLYDTTAAQCVGTPATGLMISNIKPPNGTPTDLVYNLILQRGLCVVNSAASDVTLSFNSALSY